MKHSQEIATYAKENKRKIYQQCAKKDCFLFGKLAVACSARTASRRFTRKDKSLNEITASKFNKS